MSGTKLVIPPRLFTLTPLQQRVVELGRCPDCHAKTLVTARKPEGLEVSQCSRCSRLYILNLDETEES